MQNGHMRCGRVLKRVEMPVCQDVAGETKSQDDAYQRIGAIVGVKEESEGAEPKEKEKIRKREWAKA